MIIPCRNKRLKQLGAMLVAASLSYHSFANEEPKVTSVTPPSAPSRDTEQSTNILVTDKNPIFQIKLAANPTTGYLWFLDQYDEQLLEPMQHQYHAPASHLIGAGGFDVWTFRVRSQAFVVPRQTTIRLRYARPSKGLQDATVKVFVISMLTES